MKTLVNTKPLAAALALTGLAAFVPAAQAQSIDVQVIGTITPAACVPAIAGGGVIDYGKIAASTVSRTDYTVLPAKDVSFTITCDAATRVAVATVDNAAASRIGGIVLALGPGYNDTQNFGLGTVSGANVGGYVMNLRQGSFTVDGTAQESIASFDNGTTWVGQSLGAVYHNNGLNSWGTAATGPVAGAVISGTLGVQGVLNKGSELPLSADVPLAGSATMTLTYL